MDRQQVQDADAPPRKMARGQDLAENSVILEKADRAALDNPIAKALLQDADTLARLEDQFRVLGLTAWKSCWQVYMFLVLFAACTTLHE